MHSLVSHMKECVSNQGTFQIILHFRLVVLDSVRVNVIDTQMDVIRMGILFSGNKILVSVTSDSRARFCSLM